jgi:hypothetical protein
MITEKSLKYIEHTVGFYHGHVGETLVTIVSPFFHRGGTPHLWTVYNPKKGVGDSIKNGEATSLEHAIMCVNRNLEREDLVGKYDFNNQIPGLPVSWRICHEVSGTILCSGLASNGEEAIRAVEQNISRLKADMLSKATGNPDNH